MEYKNRIIELFNPTTKQILYTALQNNQNIMYTRNLRSVPLRTKTGIENIYMVESENNTYTIVINPDKSQLEYFDYKILNIEEAITKDIEILELKQYLQSNTKDRFIRDIKHFTFLSQYEAEEVYNYINNL